MCDGVTGAGMGRADRTDDAGQVISTHGRHVFVVGEASWHHSAEIQLRAARSLAYVSAARRGKDLRSDFCGAP